SILFLIICWLIRDSLNVKDLNGKHVFITGCDSGFGNLLAKQLDQRGFHVIAACLTEKGSRELLACTSLSLKTVILNLTDSISIDNAVEFVKQETDGEGKWYSRSPYKLLNIHQPP
uniref:Retinol dehydrogenase 5 n=1 Tax=Terrapene triunguis TaxID=2587831 RepID=A0A674K2B8_9SAUR